MISVKVTMGTGPTDSLMSFSEIAPSFTQFKWTKALPRKNGNVEPLISPLEPAMPPETQMMKLLAERDGKRTLYFLPQYYPAALLDDIAVRRGIRVPEEIGIAAYDQHSLLSQFVKPALTTIDPKIREMAEEALRLARCLKDGTKPKSRTIEAEFFPGESAIHI